MHRRIPKLVWAALTAVSVSVHAANAVVQGYWREPSGAVLQIARCEGTLCVEIVALSAANHPHVDVHNPNPALRSRSLCGLRIGAGFFQSDPQHAQGGHLYDPRTGRTYRGSMTAEGDRLMLRGYIGIKLLGRTEIWTRAGTIARPCQPQK